MNIGFDAKRAFTNFTGLGNYSRFIIKALLENFPSNSYYLYTPTPTENKELEFIKESNITIRTPPQAMSNLKLKSFWRSFLIPGQIGRDKIDIYHGLSNELPFGLNKGKKVVSIHDLLFLRYPQLYKPLDVEIYKAKWKYSCKRADKIVAISQQTAEDLNHFLKVPISKITVVYQGCHDMYKREYSSHALQSVKEKYKLPDRFILNVGTIEARKNALNIVKALSLLKKETDIPLVIVGRPTSYKEQIVEFAKKEGLTERLIFLHNVDFMDLPIVYKLSTVFVYPSIFEGFGIPIVEAMEMGVAVITSKGSCFSEAGGPDSKYVDPLNHEELASAVSSLVNERTLRDSMAMSGKEYVRKFHDKKIAEDIMDVYYSL